MSAVLEFDLSFSGNLSDKNLIDFYDAADALSGFQRYLALTTHLVLNGEIITHAPKLKGARIIAAQPEIGSWKFKSLVVAGGAMASVSTGIYAVGTADKDTPIGNFGRSVYEYVVSETLGVNPDYEKTIGAKYREEKRKNPDFPDLSQAKIDSLLEKCENAIYRMHRPIVASKTAKQGKITIRDPSGTSAIAATLDKDSYDYMSFNQVDERHIVIAGRVTSYNVHTYKGRIYIPEEKRPIAFEIADFARTPENINSITPILSETAADRINDISNIRCFVHRVKSRSGRIKFMQLVKVLYP